MAARKMARPKQFDGAPVGDYFHPRDLISDTGIYEDEKGYYVTTGEPADEDNMTQDVDEEKARKREHIDNALEHLDAATDSIKSAIDELDEADFAALNVYMRALWDARAKAVCIRANLQYRYIETKDEGDRIWYLNGRQGVDYFEEVEGENQPGPAPRLGTKRRRVIEDDSEDEEEEFASFEMLGTEEGSKSNQVTDKPKTSATSLQNIDGGEEVEDDIVQGRQQFSLGGLTDALNHPAAHSRPTPLSASNRTVNAPRPMQMSLPFRGREPAPHKKKTTDEDMEM